MSIPFFEVYLAENGLEAYEIAISKPKYFFDAILLDIQMPILDGF
jgi:CheY-like chemotaxis protein